MRELFLAVFCVAILAVDAYQVNFVGYRQSDQPLELLIKKFNKCGKNAFYNIFTGSCDGCSQCNKNEFVVDACTAFDDTVCSTCFDLTHANTFAYQSKCKKLDATHDGVVRPFSFFNPDRVKILSNTFESDDAIRAENNIVVDTPTIREAISDEEIDAEYESDEDEYFESRVVKPVRQESKDESLVPMNAPNDDNRGTDNFDSNSIESESDEYFKTIKHEESKENGNTFADESVDKFGGNHFSDETKKNQDSVIFDEDGDDNDQQLVEISSAALKTMPKYRALLERKNEPTTSGKISDLSDTIRNSPYNRENFLLAENSDEDINFNESTEISDDTDADDLIRTVEINYGEVETKFEYENAIYNHRTRIAIFSLYFLGALVILAVFCGFRRVQDNNRTYVVTPPIMTPQDKKNIISAFDHIKKSRRGQYKYQLIAEFV